jgi:hypothetical protein
MFGIDGDAERCDQLAGVLERIAGRILAVQLALRGVALGEMHHLSLHRVDGPDIPVGRDDDALHVAELALQSPSTRGQSCRALLGVVDLKVHGSRPSR